MVGSSWGFADGCKSSDLCPTEPSVAVVLKCEPVWVKLGLGIVAKAKRSLGS